MSAYPSPRAAVTRRTRRPGVVAHLRANAELTVLVGAFIAGLILAFATRGLVWAAW